jgi:hypothetical protein
MGSVSVRVFGLVSGVVLVGEVIEEAEGGWVLKNPGMIQLVPSGDRVVVGMLQVAEASLFADFGGLMERFPVPRPAVMYVAQVSAKAVNLYFKFLQNLREKISGIKVVSALPGVQQN